MVVWDSRQKEGDRGPVDKLFRRLNFPWGQSSKIELRYIMIGYILTSYSLTFLMTVRPYRRNSIFEL
jgi:hypothetical protein